MNINLLILVKSIVFKVICQHECMNKIIRAPLVIDLPTPLIKIYILVLYEDIPTYLAIFLTLCDF